MCANVLYFCPTLNVSSICLRAHSPILVFPSPTRVLQRSNRLVKSFHSWWLSASKATCQRPSTVCPQSRNGSVWGRTHSFPVRWGGSDACTLFSVKCSAILIGTAKSVSVFRSLSKAFEMIKETCDDTRTEESNRLKIVANLKRSSRWHVAAKQRESVLSLDDYSHWIQKTLTWRFQDLQQATKHDVLPFLIDTTGGATSVHHDNTVFDDFETCRFFSRNNVTELFFDPLEKSRFGHQGESWWREAGYLRQ